MTTTIKLIAASAVDTWTTGQNVLKIANDVAVESLTTELASADAVELHFPKFSDGRAFSQATQLRRRLGFTGDIRATGDVLIDQVLQMQRTGFSSAVLREDQSAAHAQKLLHHYSGFYQGDAQKATPHFA
jgi:uncharacterized protein (DUF934 family)